MKHLLCAAAVLLTTVACWATAAGAASGSVSAADRAFVAKVSQGGMFEVAAGRLAAVRGSRQDIRDLGTTELHDHMLVGSRLVSIITPLAIAHSSALNAIFARKLRALAAVSGSAFDRAFVTAMNDVHAKDGAAFAQEAVGGTNADLRAFAAETHRIVERHLGALHALGAG